MIRTLPRVPLRAIDAAHEAFPSVRWPGSPPDEPFGGPLASRRVRPGYLFATGCERSGTTVLTRLLQSHPSVAIGMERYKYLLRDVRTRRVTRRLCPSHFEPGRFFDFRPSDTNIIPPNFGDYYDESARRYRSDELRYVGDKVLPPNVWLVRTMANRFPQAKFVLIYRDQVRVCDSWQRRSSNPEDQWVTGNDYRAGHDHWVDGLDVADWLRSAVAPERVFLTRCEWFFGEDVAHRDGLIRFLGLELDGSFAANHAERGAEFRRRERETTPILTADQLAELAQVAMPDRVAALDAATLECRDRPAARPVA